MNSSLSVRIAKTTEDIQAAKRLRFQTFFTDLDIPPPEDSAASGMDEDRFDQVAEHLIVVDESFDNLTVVGNYRLIRAPNFYSSQRYDLSALMTRPERLLEVGRSCVHRDYRSGAVMQLLWRGLANYILEKRIEVIFGCASFEGAYVGDRGRLLAYLYHYHLAPAELRPRARQECLIPMNESEPITGTPRAIWTQFPALVKGYLRLGAYVGDGAVFDVELDQLDVCVVLETQQITKRYARHYLRSGQYAA
ncbi:MAG: GNAT family N-acyltransferase [Pseudomonadota bacterium]